MWANIIIWRQSGQYKGWSWINSDLGGPTEDKNEGTLPNKRRK